jgi:hypothetical protein
MSRKETNTYILFILAFYAFIGIAQTQKDSLIKEGYLLAEGGYSQPLGVFKSTNIIKGNTGWAKPGSEIAVSYIRKIAKRLSVSLTFISGENKRDIKSLQDYYTKTYPGYSFTIASDSWKFKSLMLGLQCSVLKTRKLTINVAGAPGVMATTFPQLSFSINSAQTGPYSIIITAPMSKAFAFLLGVNMRYSFTDFFSLLVEANYLSSNPFFEYTKYVSGSVSNINETPGNRSIQLLTINLGMGFRIN